MDKPKVNHAQLTILLLIGDAELSALKISEVIGALTDSTGAFNLGWVMYILSGLERMGYVKSYLGKATLVRGGNRQRFYNVTTSWKKQRDAALTAASVPSVVDKNGHEETGMTPPQNIDAGKSVHLVMLFDTADWSLDRIKFNTAAVGICLSCPLNNCDEASPHCQINIKVKQFRRATSRKGRLTRNAYYKKNRERLLLYFRTYYRENRGKIAAYKRIYRRKNRGKIAAYERVSRGKNRERIASYQRTYREKNRKRILAQRHTYREKNRKRILARNHAYRKKNREKLKMASQLHYWANRGKILHRRQAHRGKNNGA